MGEGQVVRRISEPLYRAKGWIKLAGILLIVQGVFSILSIWGILICWLPIWMGVILMSASNELETAYATEDEAALTTSMGKLGTYFKIFGIFAIVMAILAALLIPAIVAARDAGAGM